jgi:colanic acid biosynthesis glycosyl transferase WcaI
VVGEGPSKIMLHRLKTEKNLNNFYLLQLQPRKKMLSIISAADCCVVMLASQPIFQIALPTKFYEYIACRKPIIGVCSGELARIILDKGIGYVVSHRGLEEFVEAIGKTASTDSSNTISSNLDLAAEEYSLDGISEQFRKILQNILN